MPVPDPVPARSRGYFFVACCRPGNGLLRRKVGACLCACLSVWLAGLAG